MNADALRDFVRGTLGCTCGDEVFRNIRFDHPSAADGTAVTTVAIGGRLLLYLLPEAGTVEMATLVDLGRERRDRDGFNRLRLVLPAPEETSAQTDLQDAFRRCAGGDPRLHLHLVGERQLRDAAAALEPRCPWADNDTLYRDYHDTEWGVPIGDDRTLFEFLILEGAQAGLSWSTILKKRPHYRSLYAGFDPQAVARFDHEKQQALLQDPGIVRNRLKVAASVSNATAFLEVQERHGSFAAWLWEHVDGVPLQNSWRSLQEVPTSTPLSDRLSRDLKRRGFRFVGTTICYAFMQAVGLVNDHLATCFRHRELAVRAPRTSADRPSPERDGEH